MSTEMVRSRQKPVQCSRLESWGEYRSRLPVMSPVHLLSRGALGLQKEGDVPCSDNDEYEHRKALHSFPVDFISLQLFPYFS
jgi:hypothetical protein